MRQSKKPKPWPISRMRRADAKDLVAIFSRQGLDSTNLVGRIQAEQERYGQFTPIMRFILADAETRTFGMQRMCYLGSIDDWIDIGATGTVEELAHQLIPTLGTDRFFELY